MAHQFGPYSVSYMTLPYSKNGNGPKTNPYVQNTDDDSERADGLRYHQFVPKLIHSAGLDPGLDIIIYCSGSSCYSV